MVFIAVMLPEHVVPSLQTALTSFAGVQPVPRERWHMTLLWLGRVVQTDQSDWLTALTQPVAETFLPTISLRYAGLARAGRQLWIYAQVTPVLVKLRQELINRLQRAGVTVPQLDRPWVPHIHLADFLPPAPAATADRLLPPTTFVPTAAEVLRDYVIEGSIPFA